MKDFNVVMDFLLGTFLLLKKRFIIVISFDIPGPIVPCGSFLVIEFCISHFSQGTEINTLLGKWARPHAETMKIVSRVCTHSLRVLLLPYVTSFDFISLLLQGIC